MFANLLLTNIMGGGGTSGVPGTQLFVLLIESLLAGNHSFIATINVIWKIKFTLLDFMTEIQKI